MSPETAMQIKSIHWIWPTLLLLFGVFLIYFSTRLQKNKKLADTKDVYGLPLSPQLQLSLALNGVVLVFLGCIALLVKWTM